MNGTARVIRVRSPLEATITARLGQRSAHTPARLPSKIAGRVLAAKMPVVSRVISWASGPTPPLLRPGLLPTPCWRSKSAASARGPELMSVVCAQFWAIRNTINTM